MIICLLYEIQDKMKQKMMKCCKNNKNSKKVIPTLLRTVPRSRRRETFIWMRSVKFQIERMTYYVERSGEDSELSSQFYVVLLHYLAVKRGLFEMSVTNKN